MVNLLLMFVSEPLGELLKRAMFPPKADFFGLSLNPTLIAAFLVTITLLILASVIRIFVIPKFKNVPNGLQLMLESLVGFFDKIAKDTADEESGIVGSYIFTAALYICFGTLIELIGFRPIMSSINTCVAVALSTYFMLLFYGIKYKGFMKGFLNSVKEITVPVSMTFRLYGSILSGFLIMEIVYHYIWLSVAVPAVLSLIFTLFHAFIQSYIFAMLSSLFIGEALEKHHIEKQELETITDEIQIIAE